MREGGGGSGIVTPALNIQDVLECFRCVKWINIVKTHILLKNWQKICFCSEIGGSEVGEVDFAVIN